MHAHRDGVAFPRIVPANAQRFQAKCVALGLETQRPITPGVSVAKGICHIAETRGHGVWIPACAGTTRRKVVQVTIPVV